MKKLLMLLLVASCGLVRAQTNLPAAKPAVEPTMGIDSTSLYFDKIGRQAIYQGNVRVTNSEADLRCERLTVDLPATGHRLSHIYAETNVVVDIVQNNKKYHVTSDRAVYDYKVADLVTNETITFTGSPKVVSDDGTLTGDPLIWDQTTKLFSGTHTKMIFRENLSGGTNASPLNLF